MTEIIHTIPIRFLLNQMMCSGYENSRKSVPLQDNGGSRLTETQKAEGKEGDNLALGP